MDYAQKISENVPEIEEKYGVCVLWSIESGSRVWGFDSSDSDYDVRFVYVRPLSWYLTVQDRRDVIEPYHADTLLDFSGWDLRKALFQLYRGNPQLIEWITSPWVYTGLDNLKKWQPLVKQYWNRKTAYFHYLHMAKRNWKQYVENDPAPNFKKTLYVLRPLLNCWFMELFDGALPPLNFEKVFTSVVFAATESLEQSFIEDVWKLWDLKVSGTEQTNGPAWPSINNWIEMSFEHFRKQVYEGSKVMNTTDVLDEFFLNEVMRKGINAD